MHLYVGDFSITTFQGRHEGYFGMGKLLETLNKLYFTLTFLFHIMI